MGSLISRFLSPSSPSALVVEFLKSYENYGQAVVWVTAGWPIKNNDRNNQESQSSQSQFYLEWSARVALSRAWSSKAFKEACAASLDAKDFQVRARAK